MAGLRITQTSFLGGEISPLAYMRFDRPFYEHSAAALLNMTIRVQGACETRPGSFLHDTLEGPSIEFEWVFSPVQAYLLVLTDERLRVYDNTTLVKVFDSTAGGAIWHVEHFERLTFTQQLNTMIVCHPDLQTIKILRTSATTFTIAPFTFDGNLPLTRILQPHYKFVAPTVTLTPSATSGTITLTASLPVFVAGHVGARFRIVNKEVGILSVSSPTAATAQASETLTGTAATQDWSEPAFSTVRGWPNTAQFFGDRLIFGGSRDRPLAIWLSQIGKYFNFDLGTSQDNEAIWETIGQADVSEIRHMVVDRNLLVFADAAVFMVANSETTPLTPKNFKIPPQAQIGASYLRPKTFDGGVLFRQAESNLIRLLRYNDVDQKYNTETSNMLSPHLVDAPVRMARTFAVAPRQENIALFANADGTIAAYHANSENEISAWTPWQLGGDMLCRSVCAVREKIWAVAELDGVRLLLRFDWDAPPLDAATALTAVSATRVWPGLATLASRTLDVWSNGYALGSVAVAPSGTAILPDTAPMTTAAAFGFAFRQQVTPMPYHASIANGSTHGRVLGLIRYYVDVTASGSFAIGGVAPDVSMSADITQPAPQFTGICSAFHLGYDESAQFELVIDQPQRITLRGITREVRIGG